MGSNPRPYAMKLNLGCGSTEIEGHIGIDIIDYGHNIVRDLRRGIPFFDESMVEITAKHFLEHLEQDDVIFMIDECWRVLRPGGKLIIEVPSYRAEEAYVFGHKTIFSEDTFRASECFKRWTIEKINTNNALRLFVILVKPNEESKT